MFKVLEFLKSHKTPTIYIGTVVVVSFPDI